MDSINAADTAWVMVCGALVLLMTPGLALFYGGMVRAKSALNMIMMSFAALGVVTIAWITVGFTIAFGASNAGVVGGLTGGLRDIGLVDTIGQTVGAPGHKIPMLAFVMFQLTFAVITPALVIGAFATAASTFFTRCPRPLYTYVAFSTPPTYADSIRLCEP